MACATYEQSGELTGLTRVRGFTIDAAYQLRMEDEIGSIEVGKKADLIVLDQNIFEVNGIPVDATNASERIPASINLVLNKEVEVEGTIVNGTLIASKVKDESEDTKIAATVSNPSFSADSFYICSNIYLGSFC